MTNFIIQDLFIQSKWKDENGAIKRNKRIDIYCPTNRKETPRLSISLVARQRSRKIELRDTLRNGRP